MSDCQTCGSSETQNQKVNFFQSGFDPEKIDDDTQRVRTFEDRYIVTDWDFAKNPTVRNIIIFLILTNIISNILFYTRYVYYSPVLGGISYVNVVTKFRFMIIVSVIIVSMLLTILIFLYYESEQFSKVAIYLLITEIVAIASVLIQLLWATIAILGGASFLVLFKIDLSETAYVKYKKSSTFMRFSDKVKSIFYKIKTKLGWEDE